MYWVRRVELCEVVTEVEDGMRWDDVMVFVRAVNGKTRATTATTTRRAAGRPAGDWEVRERESTKNPDWAVTVEPMRG